MTPQELLENYNNENQTIEFVVNAILNGEYTILPDIIAHGKVLKIHFNGDLIEEGYEQGFLVLTPNSGIKKHKHINDIEMYTLLHGTLSIDGIICNKNICLIDEKHGIDTVTELTIIKTLKVNKRLLQQKINVLRIPIK